MLVGGVYIFFKPLWWIKEFVSHSSEVTVFKFWLITYMHFPNISLYNKKCRYLNIFEPFLCFWYYILDSIWFILWKINWQPFLWFLQWMCFLILNEKALKCHISWKVCSRLALWWNFQQHLFMLFWPLWKKLT